MTSPFSNYTYVRHLGQGAFGSAFLVKDDSTSKLYCVKEILLTRAEQTQSAFNELRLLSLTTLSPFLVHYHQFVRQSDRAFILMEYCEGGSVADLITKYNCLGQSIPNDLIWRILFSVLKGLNFIHSQVVHRDIKPDNILFLTTDTSSSPIKICDFGLSKDLDESMATMTGTLLYLSPEVIKQEKYGKSVDFWGLGVVLFQLCTGKLPFASLEEILFSQVQGLPAEKAEFSEIILGLLEKDSSKRFDYQSIMALPTVKKQFETISFKSDQQSQKSSINQIDFEIDTEKELELPCQNNSSCFVNYFKSKFSTNIWSVLIVLLLSFCFSISNSDNYLILLSISFPSFNLLFPISAVFYSTSLSCFLFSLISFLLNFEILKMKALPFVLISVAFLIAWTISLLKFSVKFSPQILFVWNFNIFASIFFSLFVNLYIVFSAFNYHFSLFSLLIIVSFSVFLTTLLFKPKFLPHFPPFFMTYFVVSLLTHVFDSIISNNLSLLSVIIVSHGSISPLLFKTFGFVSVINGNCRVHLHQFSLLFNYFLSRFAILIPLIWIYFGHASFVPFLFVFSIIISSRFHLFFNFVPSVLLFIVPPFVFLAFFTLENISNTFLVGFLLLTLCVLALWTFLVPKCKQVEFRNYNYLLLLIGILFQLCFFFIWIFMLR
ncbi:hypothetical protein RCL1_002271 [Eukaryota sp. TZLM3-RCL]